MLNCLPGDALLQAEGVVLDDENTDVEKVKIIYSKQADFNMVLGIGKFYN
ncbi:hypothetical protein [Furfurilactobacillus milii]|nr:hypothetical protein [Furfurilactobacillus milii]